MTNPYFTNNLDPAMGSAIKSAAFKNQGDAIEAAFDLVYAAIASIQGAGGITSLSGFPASFSGQAGKIPVVNAAETGLVFRSASAIDERSIGGTTYTLVASDAGSLLVFTNAAGCTVTVPGSVLSQGDVVCIRQGAAGQVTLTPGGGVTLSSSDNLLSTRTQSAQIALVVDGATNFTVIGERNAAAAVGLSLQNLFTKGQTVTPVALSDGATVNTDASLSNTFIWTIGGAGRTLANPTNLADGEILNWYIKQDGTGNRTITSWGSYFKFASGTTPALSTAAGAVDLLVGQYSSSLNIIACNFSKGYA